jgi:hypothetical protein
MYTAVQNVMQANQAALASQIQTAVLAKQLETTELQGQAVVEMLGQAADRSGKAIDRGQCFDAVA